MIKVSIVMPIYNSEKYLDRSIKSLLDQYLEDIEIILINDGSQDNSLNICKKFAEKDDRITVINKKNEGVSVARNVGLALCKGEYIAFVDSDDYVDPKMYEHMYNTITTEKADMCMCNYIVKYRNIELRKNHSIQLEIIKDSNIIKTIIGPIIGADDISGLNSMTGFRSPCVYLYKNSIIKSNGIKFDQEISIGEDFLFNINYLKSVKKVSVLKDYYYYYCQNENSATQKYVDNWWEIHKRLIIKIEENLTKENKEQLKVKLEVLKISYYIGAIVNEAHKDNKNTFKKKMNTLKTISSEDILKDTLEEYDYRKLSLSRKFWFIMLKKKKITLLYLYYKAKTNRKYKV